MNITTCKQAKYFNKIQAQQNGNKRKILLYVLYKKQLKYKDKGRFKVRGYEAHFKQTNVYSCIQRR